jgi:hypothetical protein
LDNKINEIELWREHDSKKCAACNNIPLKIIKTKKGTVMYGCPNWTPNEPDGNHDHAWCTDEQKQQAPEKLKQLEELYYQKKQLKSTPPKIDFEKIKGTLRHTSINFDDYPNILETSYNNYLFQSLAVPSGTPFKENFNELLRYSRFRIFTKLQSHEIDDSTRTVYSLALRLMNRGVVLGTNEKTEAKINRCFENSAECSKLVLLMKSIGYNGIFDIEMLKSGNKFYLNEINFRNGAAGYSLTKSGINLPSIYVNYLLNSIPFPTTVILSKGLTFVNDKAALDHYIAGECTKSGYNTLVNSVDIRLIDNKDDRFAQLSFKFLRLKLLFVKFINNLKSKNK